jgi:hypothetical protein
LAFSSEKSLPPVTRSIAFRPEARLIVVSLVIFPPFRARRPTT